VKSDPPRFVLIKERASSYSGQDKTVLFIQWPPGIAGEKVHASDTQVSAIICRLPGNVAGMMLVSELFFSIHAVEKCNPV
jgi:hypothetical protein